MLLHVAPLRERLVAEVAGEGPLARVREGVALEVVLALEHFAALYAVVTDGAEVFGLHLAVERPQVRLEAGFVFQHFAAELTRGWRGRGFVRLGVGLEIFLVEVLLVADLAGEKVARRRRRGLGSLAAAEAAVSRPQVSIQGLFVPEEESLMFEHFFNGIF